MRTPKIHALELVVRVTALLCELFGRLIASGWVGYAVGIGRGVDDGSCNG